MSRRGRRRVRALLAAYRDKRDLIAIGAYERGSDPLDRPRASSSARHRRLPAPAGRRPVDPDEADDGLLDLVAGAAAAMAAEVAAEVPVEAAPPQRSVACPPTAARSRSRR